MNDLDKLISICILLSMNPFFLLNWGVSFPFVAIASLVQFAGVAVLTRKLLQNNKEWVNLLADH